LKKVNLFKKGMMLVPALDLKAQYLSIKEEIDRKIFEIVSSQQFILGQEVEEFEKEITNFCETKYAVGVSSGSDALLISLMALGVQEGDIVATTPFTFFATAGTVARLRATPVFCDIDPKTYNLSPEKLEELLKKRRKNNQKSEIKIVIPVHLYGQSSDMSAILSLSEEYEFKVLSDAAQAIGADYPGEERVWRVCSLGKASIISFYPSKNLGAYGDGGMVVTNDSELSEKLKMLRVHGARNKYFYELIGGNFRLDALQAAILRVKLKYLEGWIKARQEKALLYEQMLIHSGLVERELIIPPVSVYKNRGVKNYHTFHQYVIRARERDKLHGFLRQNGIGAEIYYPLPLHLQPCFSYLGYKQGSFPEAEKAAREVLALPIYPELSIVQQEYVISKIIEFYKECCDFI